MNNEVHNHFELRYKIIRFIFTLILENKGQLSDTNFQSAIKIFILGIIQQWNNQRISIKMKNGRCFSVQLSKYSDNTIWLKQIGYQPTSQRTPGQIAKYWSNFLFF